MQLFDLTRERFYVVHQDISEGSEPARRFYILVAVSTLIAGFGLISNSTAVVIGAMLVAPLMTPIFGISILIRVIMALCLSLLMAMMMILMMISMMKNIDRNRPK